MSVPNVFANATTSIPLVQLDQNFNTGITLGNTTVYLGNTTTSFGNVTLTGAAVNGTVGATTPAAGKFTTINSDATGNLSIQSNGSTVVAVTSAGAAVTGTFSATNVLSGTYTPTLTNGANMAASTAQPLQYLRVGNTVVVGGYVGIDTTAGSATSTAMRMSLPIASNFTTSTDAGGSGSSPVTGGASDGWYFYANAGTDDIQIEGNSMDTAARNLFFTFVYQIK